MVPPHPYFPIFRPARPGHSDVHVLHSMVSVPVCSWVLLQALQLIIVPQNSILTNRLGALILADLPDAFPLRLAQQVPALLTDCIQLSVTW